MKKNMIFKMLLVILILAIIFYKPIDNTVPAEDLNIPSAVGFDTEKTGSDIIYRTSISSYIFSEMQNTQKKVTVGYGFSPIQSREDRVLQVNKNYVIGLEKVDVIGEQAARNGIRGILDMLFNIPEVNDTALVAVYEGKARDFLNINVKGYPTSGDYLEQMINSSRKYNFFEDNYKIIDVFVKVDSEGRTVKLPYIKNTKDGIVMDGIALFKKDKMMEKVDIQDARILNMLSGDAGKGVITLQKGSDKYTDYYAKVKRKVKCTRKDGKYIFNIKLDFKGDLITNSYIKSAQNDIKEKEKIEKELKNKIENECNDFVKKSKEVYKIDCFELGRVAAAKYGRDTGTDWDKTISNSEINVKASVKIINQGRGEY